MQPPLMQHQPPRLILIHQRDVVGRDHDRGAGPVEFDEQPQQAPPRVGSTLPVGSSASKRCGREITARAIAARLLLAAGQDRRQCIHPLAEADTFQEVDDLLAIARFLAAITRNGSATFS